MNRRVRSALRWAFGLLIVLAVGSAATAVALRWLRPTVTVTEPVDGPVVQAFYATGTITPEREYPIKSNVAGVVVEVRADKGQRVRKGQVLAVVRSDDLPLKLAQAKAELDEKRQRADERASPVLRDF